MTHTTFDTESLLSARAKTVDLSGIRRVFSLAASLADPINLSIGQPDFAVPEPIRAGAIRAIESGQNGYSASQGDPALLACIGDWLKTDLGWDSKPYPTPSAEGESGPRHFVTSGTSGALQLLFMSLLEPGDECVIPDPYFVSYPHLATLVGAKAVHCDTYPDFRLTAERVEPLLTEKTKFVLLNTPSNPSGVVSSKEDCQGLVDLCRSRGVLLVTDEIYDEFCYPEGLSDVAAGDASLARCPSPARLEGAQDSVLLIRGFGKTYGCTGWRLGYAAGPKPIIEQMAKIQQYTFVCAPAPLQAGVTKCFETDMSEQIADYQARRDLVVQKLSPHVRLSIPAGAFYAFFEVPEAMGLTGTEFVERGIKHNLLTIPGECFSRRDTHVRLSFASKPESLGPGLDLIVKLVTGELV
ncbi:MAG: aspartate/methionine/tyrosine aminotransferase [Phycisphaerales bacterium]|jgi:aspartate/methionine/tyrosine aminotransferase